MNYRNILKAGAILLASATLTLTACKKNNNSTGTPALTNSDDNGGYASDAARMETNSNDVISIADMAKSSGSANLRVTSGGGYPTVTFAASGGDTTMTINFGTTPFLCRDLRYRSGEILVTYNGPYKATGTVRTITYNSYFVDSNQITGSKTVTNEGTNDSGQVYYNVTVNDSMILNGTDSIVTWTGTRIRTWLAGYTSSDWSSAVYSIANGSGAATVLRRADGNVFTFNITTPLIIAMDCPYIEAGTIDVSSTSFVHGDRILDYGSTSSPTCDAAATLTIDGITYSITLRR